MIQKVFRLGTRFAASDSIRRHFHREPLKKYERGLCRSHVGSFALELVRNTETQTLYQTYYIRIFIITKSPVIVCT